MPSMLDQLKAMTTVVADTGDIDAVRRLQPIDCTTNPSIILKAIAAPEFKDAFLEAIDWGARSSGSIEARVAAVADRLAVSVGAALAEIVPGRVSTEVDADLSFDMVASVARAEKIIEDYAQRGIDRERILVKLASTWEGIRAAQELQQKGIDCNLTLLFSKAQAIACANAGVFLISPFVGRIYDWHVKATGEPGLFTEPCSAFGSWRFRGPGRPLSGALSRIWRWLAGWSHHRACFRRISGAGGHVLRMTAGRAEAVSGSQTL